MNVPPKRILLSTDGSDGAALATRAGIDLANRAGAELHVTHAWAPIHHDTYPVTCCSRTPDYSHLYAEDARKLINEQVDRIQNNEYEAGRVEKAHLRKGRPVNEICNLSEELEADLTVLGGGVHGPVRRVFTSGFSKSFLRKASCPTLIVRGGGEAWPPSCIALSEGLSESDLETGRLAASLGSLLEAPVLGERVDEQEELVNEAHTKVQVTPADSTSCAARTGILFVVGAEELCGTRRIKQTIKSPLTRALLRVPRCSVLVSPRLP